MAANATQHSISAAEVANFHPPEGAVVIATASELQGKNVESIRMDDGCLIAFAPLATALVCMHSTHPPAPATNTTSRCLEYPCGEVGGARMTSQSAQEPDKGIASNPETKRLQEHFNLVSHP